MSYRNARDFLGEVCLPAAKLWGPQTQRSLAKFSIGWEQMPAELISALILIKKMAARVNCELGLLPLTKKQAMVQACQELLSGKFRDNFPLSVWQTGSGTQTNMNVNEVIARRANQILGAEEVQAHDHVNLGQSSNDVFPSAIHLAAVLALEKRLLPEIELLKKTLRQKSKDYQDVLKLGRTHLQDALPLTFGQEISAWEEMLKKAEVMLKESGVHLRELALGGTAVGTGLNTDPQFAVKVIAKINEFTQEEFRVASNKFYALTSKAALVGVHGVLQALAADLMKIANDLRWLASGPRGGLGEISLPANEPGSSMMPGKVNPTQCEALTMVVCQVMGNDVTLGLAASQGNLQLNVFLPVCAYNFLQSVTLLSETLHSFRQNCVEGLVAHPQQMRRYLDNSLMLATALTPILGYEKVAELVAFADTQKITLKEAVLKLELMTAPEFAQMVCPEKMV